MNAINAAALPPGSSAVKKASLFNLSIQMHLGGAMTAHTFDKDGKAPKSWKDLMSVTLPVGVSLNTGFGKGGCLGLFGSIIDIGALAQYQIESSSQSQSLNERITFQNVFSPGVMLSYGFPWNLPLSLNFGAQYGPGLTSVSSSSTQTVNPTWRLLGSLTVDIPAFTIVNINKRGPVPSGSVAPKLATKANRSRKKLQKSYSAF
jgi:hypothetical protein